MHRNTKRVYGARQLCLAYAAGGCSIAPSSMAAWTFAISSAPGADWSWLLIAAIALPFVPLIIYALWDPATDKSASSRLRANNTAALMRRGDGDEAAKPGM